EATERYWRDHKHLIEDGWEGWWLDGMESVWDAADDRRVGHVPQGYLPRRAKLDSQEFRDEYDNVWALLRAKAFYEKQRRDFPDRRVYILNRTAFSGMQRYAAGVNQGDFWSSWELLRVQRNWLLNMAMSGVLFPESDIGGFYPTEELTDELFIRWAFMATFAPLMRSHGCNWRCRLPWGFGPENEERFVRLIRLRHAMFPYNYTLLHEANRTGIPMMRPMALEFPHDGEVRTMCDQYMWGPYVLVAPVAEKGARERQVYLPEGVWLHGWTLQRFEGPNRVVVEAPLGRDPFFFRAGAVLPICEPSASIPTQSDAHLTLLVLPSEREGAFTLYDDDRSTYRYEKGECSRQESRVSPLREGGAFSLELGAVEGDHLVVAQAFTPEDVEGAADGEVQTPAAEVADDLQVPTIADAAGVGDGDALPPAEHPDQVGLDALAAPLDVGGVDQELGAGAGEPVEAGRIHLDGGELLPTVGDDPVAVVAFAATQIEDEARAPHAGDEAGEALLVDPPVAKDVRGDDDSGGSALEPGRGVFLVDAAADVESPGVGPQGVLGRRLVAGAEHDHVPAG
ncbi:MAG: glycoside hydrolase family 31 protein, partial [Longimicrobiales bacterium]|nr:glycoside hydrolase family 31 protein [Longimicrobiales bacterium]